MTHEPLIHTTRGNLPVAALTYAAEWEHTPTAIVLRERYRAADGAIVRESAHVYVLPPAPAGAQASI